MAPPPLPRQLAELSELLGQMCTTVAGALRSATTALLDGRERLAHQVVVGDAEVDALRVRVEETATDALLLRAPVAGDLRAVVAAIRSAGDIERMGDLALHVAQVVEHGRPPPVELREEFAQMGRVAVALALKAAEVVRTRNVLLAIELDADDDVMDELHERMFGVLMDRSWPHGVPVAVDATLLARYYERFADHAVAVARETVYAVTGHEPESIPIGIRLPAVATRPGQPNRPEM